jgi:H+/Cl- antiporter ClcA
MLKRGMEKFQIAKYGLMQVTAVVYGVLASGAAVKFNRSWLDQGYLMPDTFYRAMFYRDHGYYLLVVVLAWTIGAAYFSSPQSRHNFDESTVIHSGMALTLILAIVGSVIAFGGATPPPHLTFGTPLQ